MALSGPVVWAYLYGSDIALFLFLALLVFDRWLAYWSDGRAEGFALAGSLLAIFLPVVWFVVVLIVLWLAWRTLRTLRRRYRAARDEVRHE